MVGVARFELATPASRRRCSTRLSYTPNRGAAYSQLFCPAQRANRRPLTVERPGMAYDAVSRVFSPACAEKAAICTAANRIVPLHPCRGLCIYRAPSSLTAPVGASPSGKASVFGTDIPRFESWRPSHLNCFSIKESWLLPRTRPRRAGCCACTACWIGTDE